MMDYQISFQIKKDAKALHECLSPEVEKQSRDRCTITMALDKDELRFGITASDFTSLKASLNSIMNSIDIFEQTKGFVENEQRD